MRAETTDAAGANTSIKKEKTINMMINDFKSNLTKTINESGLPASIIEPILANACNQLGTLAQNQLREDEKAYKEE